MTDLKKLQKEIYQNKVNKGFNITDINKEFCFIHSRYKGRNAQIIKNKTTDTKEHMQ